MQKRFCAPRPRRPVGPNDLRWGVIINHQKTLERWTEVRRRRWSRWISTAASSAASRRWSRSVCDRLHRCRRWISTLKPSLGRFERISGAARAALGGSFQGNGNTHWRVPVHQARLGRNGTCSVFPTGNTIRPGTREREHDLPVFPVFPPALFPPALFPPRLPSCCSQKLYIVKRSRREVSGFRVGFMAAEQQAR